MPDPETTKEYWNENAISLVFNYLDEKELHNAFLVCKSWLKIGKSVYEKRGPVCRMLTRRYREKHLGFFPRVKTILKLVVKYPSLCIFNSNDMERFNMSEGCHCTTLPAYCISIWLDNFTRKYPVFSLSAALFPDTTCINKKMFSIKFKRSPDGYYCEEIHGNEGTRFLRANSLKKYFDPYMESQSSWKYCLIVWCCQRKFKIFKNFIKSIAECYVNNEIAIWGGTTENINICNRDPGVNTCRHPADFFFLFVSGRQMVAKTLILDQKSEIRKLIARRFRVLSEKTTLRKHSIAFMYISPYRFENFFKWETTFFKQYFPNVKLFYTVGKEPFVGNGLVDLFKTIHLPQVNEKNIHTTLLLISYN